MPLLSTSFNQPHDLLADMDALVIADIMGSDRTRQTNIGPSAMGCERCVARHFMGLGKVIADDAHDARTVPWLPYIGTQLHTRLEQVFAADNQRLIEAGFPPRWLVENRVPVARIGDEDVDGSCDLFDLWTCTVVDHKLVGKSKLDKVRRHGSPGTIYLKQANVYGRGWVLKGYEVKNVAVRFYPRNALALNQGYFWSAPFDPALAETTVARCQFIAETVASLPREQWQELLDKLPADPDCFSCGDYEDLGKAVQASHGLFDQPTPFSRR